MSLRPFIPWLVMALVASVAAMVLATTPGYGSLSSAAAAAYMLAIVGTAITVNAPLWKDHPGLGEGVATMRRNTRLAALIYAWGAAALLAVYSLSDLSWYHAWQYALGAALMASALMTYVLVMGQPGRETEMPPLMLTVLHGVAAIGGLAFLILSGKAGSLRSDWAANVVFLWGGLAVIGLCAVAFVTQRRVASGGAVA